MIFEALALEGAYRIEFEERSDERGFFARSFCREEFAAQGLETRIEQCSLSHNARRGTLRGMHYQRAPHGETKVVRCERGAIFDVIVDLRPASPTYRRWVSVQLDATGLAALYVPAGFAHGFQTLVDDTLVAYQISSPYVPEAAAGLRFDDPALAIDWPLDVSVISARDRAFPML